MPLRTTGLSNYMANQARAESHIGKLAMIILLAMTASCAPPGLSSRQAAPNPDITGAELRAHVVFLAADELEGRFPGTSGSRQAADYIAEQLARAGLTPLENMPGYRQNFDMITGVSLGRDCALKTGASEWDAGTAFTPLGFSSQGTFSGRAVYAGFGLAVPDSVGATPAAPRPDLSGKWLVIFRQPQTGSGGVHGFLNASLTGQALRAKDAGAMGVLAISSPEADTLAALVYDRTYHDAGLAVINVTSSVGDEILSALGTTAAQAWEVLIAGGQVAPALIPELEITAQIALVHETSEIGNVVGYLPGSDPALRDQYIVIGAHYDHLGWGGPGSGSLRPDDHMIHNGADDNASGVAAVIELAQRFAAQRDALKRSMLFVAFDGEEEGLLGSKYFIEHSPVATDSIILMVNLDMIGRLRDSTLMVGGTGTSPLFERILPEFNRRYQLDLQMSAEGPGPSDHSSFYGQDIPVLFMFTGAHEDYHKPSDDWQALDTTGMRIVAEFTYDVADYLNQRDARPQFTSAGMSADAPSRRSFRVTFGIIPGYGAAVDGLAVDGIKDGGPADKAGMLKGDVIVAVDGKEVKNIQDYMYRLNELNPGDTVDVQVRRAGEILELRLDL